MKKSISPFQCLEQIKIIAAQYFKKTDCEIDFRISAQYGNSIVISIFHEQITERNALIRIDILEHELKYGTDLIYSRVLKQCIERAIELKIYSPPVLVM